MSRIVDLREKEVINIRDCARLGYVTDVEIDIKTGCILKIIIAGPCKIFGLFGREKEYIINWCDIKKIGDDIIIVDVDIKIVLRDVT